MAYEHGSLDLGIRNPFRFEGTVRAIRGTITSVLGLLVLLSVTDAVQQHQIFGWITASVGFVLLSSGLWTLGSGLMQTLRFFVGRSVPTSLAFNNAKSEADSAKAEQNDVSYDAGQLEQMLIGRKNLTFTEPKGLIARLIHTLFPKLTFVPFPIRNMAQQLTETLAQTVLAVAVYGLASFVLASGLAGTEYTPLLQPVISTLFLLYLLQLWFKAGRPIARQHTTGAQNRGAAGIARTLVLAVTLPVGASMALNWWLTEMMRGRPLPFLQPLEQMNRSEASVAGFYEAINHNVSNALWIGVVVALALIATLVLTLLISNRCRQANPITEVSELRENWQESVHPREIFINLDSMVMANRRYKEVPNRIYRSLQPMLKEQSNSKGAFYGETIQETQPRVKPTSFSGLPQLLRISGTVVGQLFMLGAALLLFSQYGKVIELLSLGLLDQLPRANSRAAAFAISTDVGEQVASLINVILAIVVCGVFGRLLTNLVHVFWSEFQFESQLIYFKCEGTYTESTVSTGKGIYDSTQSENVIVRSSMTPWVVTATAVTSTFAGVGSNNLEQPRHLMELHSNDTDMAGIINDLRGYLASRQTIANLNTEADLQAAAQIHQMNDQSRNVPQPTGSERTAALAGDTQQKLDHQDG
ncbi:hypothetical protein [uncultured Ferrimonas sp.]|uniref:hypothetical protein n=1 Tax=uncultured Ferrimonas sp. TaxID=432640 RepID=UPI0026153A7F|nr:hypothetical protein [uncultured Ferrimonas sp.]